MEFFMFGIICKKFKVFNSIIIKNMIYMVNGFSRVKVSSKMLLHYKSMLSNISSVAFKRMVMRTNKNISSRIFCYAARPTRIAFSKPFFFINFFCFLRAWISKERYRISQSNSFFMFFRKFSSFSPWNISFFKSHDFNIAQLINVVNYGV